MINYKILVIDDDVLISEHLCDILRSAEFENLKIANKKSDALILINEFKPDLILLDIRMENEEDGIEIGKFIHESSSIPFIYITAHSDQNTLQKVLQTMPVSYINKPFKKADIIMAVKLALGNRPKENFIILKDGYLEHKVNVEEIKYVNSEKNYITVFLEDKRLVIRNSLEWFCSQVSENQFIKTHRSYVVNKKFIKSINSEFVLLDEIKIPVSRQNIEKLKSVFKKNL